MAETGGPNTAEEGRSPERSSFWDSFDRELAELNATIDRLQKDLPPPPQPGLATPAETAAPRARGRTKRRQTHVPPSKEPRPSEAADRPAEQSAAESVAPPQAPAEQKPAESPAALPTGTDLGDPKNFGLMPPVANLEPGTASPEEYRKRLAHDLAFASRVLHTSRVPAPVWREWRAFERAAQERLRALAGGPSPESL